MADNPLAARERQVLTFTAMGKTAAQVAVVMFLSERTINFHISKVVAKLGAANKTEAVAIAIRAGWI
ncbi:helix-turn-helix transcriptional regulator [Pseudomonas sp. dw_358]|uniref:response regulator transcription factor n=1 Tax=Pseudomonas sp. dw_358 TaxID=2720083 RepID=UPI001BD44D7D|nr:helix-turn-helix transcriptional regulator [Pseudomonas sp. dw_358]